MTQEVLGISLFAVASVHNVSIHVHVQTQTQTHAQIGVGAGVGVETRAWLRIWTWTWILAQTQVVGRHGDHADAYPMRTAGGTVLLQSLETTCVCVAALQQSPEKCVQGLVRMAPWLAAPRPCPMLP